MPAQVVRDLATLVLSRHAMVVVETTEEQRLDRLLRSVAGTVQVPLWQWSATRGLARLDLAQPDRADAATQGVYGTATLDGALGFLEEQRGDLIVAFKDVAPALSGQHAVVRRLRELLKQWCAGPRTATAILVGPTVAVPPELEGLAVRHDLGPPARDEYRETVAEVAATLSHNGRARVELASGDLDDFAAALQGLTLEEARQIVARAAVEDGVMSRADLDRIQDLRMRALRHDALLEYLAPEDNSAALGGFEGLRRWLVRARVATTPAAAAMGLRPPRGILLVGVQGCGKSLAAKVVAREWGLPLLRLDLGALYDKYVGESERNLRRALAAAESLSPAVLWIDEIEKGLSPGGDQGDGGLSRRLFGTFLTWLQEHRAPVFLVATANDLSALPPELVRKGRFDEVFFVDLPDAAERATILGIHLRARRQDPAAHDVAAVAGATEGFSGAELEQVVEGALLEALATGATLDTTRLLAEAARTVPLSVSRKEDVARLRAHAVGRYVPVR